MPHPVRAGQRLGGVRQRSTGIQPIALAKTIMIRARIPGRARTGAAGRRTRRAVKMTILLQVVEQGFTPTTPWERRQFTFVDTTKIVGMRLDGQCGVWLDLSRPGESQRLARTADPRDAITFLLTAFAKIAECEERGGSWLIGHDGARVETISATRYPPASAELPADDLLARAWL
jgi:hypothetical protein